MDTPQVDDALATAIARLAAAQEADTKSRERAARDADPEIRAYHEAMRRPLRKMSFAAFVPKIPEIATMLQVVVPKSFWSLMENRIDVACPCGATPHPSTYPSPCTGAECPRWYVYDGRDVRVAFSPAGTAPVPVPDEEMAG